MFGIRFLLTPLLLSVPVPATPLPDTSWVGKTVLATGFGTALHRMDDKGNLTPVAKLTEMGYTVLAERNDRIQIKTRYGVVGWLDKKEVVLLEDAIPYFSRLIEQNPNDANHYNRRAWAWKMRGEHDVAVQDLTAALKLRPTPALYNNRAMAWLAKKDYDKALADFSEALRLSPQYSVAYANRGQLWHAKKDYDKAIEDYSHALQFGQKIVNVYRNRGISWHAKKEYDKAISDYSEAIRLDPLSAAAYTSRGHSLLAKKEYARAGADFNEAVRIDPKNGPACSAAAMLLASCPDAKIRDGKRALDLAQQALARSKTSPVAALEAVAAAHAELRDFAEAVRRQEQALQDPGLQNNLKAQQRLMLYRDKKPYRSE